MISEEFEMNVRTVGTTMKRLLDLATGKNWTVELVFEAWDAHYICTVDDSPVQDFVAQTRYIELGRVEQFVERFGWEEYATSFALEILMYFYRRCFSFAKQSLGMVDRTPEEVHEANS